MKFFIPEWDDCVDRDYEFETDTISGTPEARQNDYIWHIFGWNKVPIDGVLVSRAQLEKSEKKVSKAREVGFYKYLEIPPNIDTISDCGAFDYIQESEPRYEPKDTLDFYHDLKVTNGVTIDHIITNKEMEDKEFRYEITLGNASKMFELWEEKDKYYENFRLIGAIQGWDIDTYKKAAQQLMDFGFRYIGVGGIAKTNTKFIKELVYELGKTIKKFEQANKEKVDVHLFGFARAELFNDLVNAGITSFDSASMLRKAWLASTSNYFKTYDERYSAIRVRYSKKYEQDLKLLEQDVLNSIRGYDSGQVEFEDVIKKLSKYEIETGESKYIEEYVRTLENKPWESCDCPICQKHKVEVCIFRGNNRNRRRGFHNTHVFYKHFKEKVPKILVFTTCTASKNESEGLIPAYKRYLQSPIFKSWWNCVHDLPVVDLGIFSAKYGLIPWWKKIPFYDQKMEENDVEKYIDELKPILGKYDKIYFHGLNLYRKVIEEISKNVDVEIFPSYKYTNRNKLDVIELMKQPKIMRMEIINNLDLKDDNDYQKQILDYL